MKLNQIVIGLCLLVAIPKLLHAKPSAKDNKQLYKTILQIDALFSYTPQSFTAMKDNVTTVDPESIVIDFPANLEEALDEILHNKNETGYLDMLYKPKSVYSDKGLAKEEAFKIYETLKEQFALKIINKPINSDILKNHLEEVKEGEIKGTVMVHKTGKLHIAQEQAIKRDLSTSWQKRFAIIILRYLANKIFTT